jgi:hypothetical protein
MRREDLVALNQAFQQSAAQREADTDESQKGVWLLSAQQMRTVIHQAGTNMDANDSDPQGDGDQSSLSLADSTQLWNIWSAGGDFVPLVQHGRISLFGNSCFYGNLSRVKQALKSVQGEAKYRMLESRESITRVTPLMMCVLGAKFLIGSEGPFQWAESAAVLVKHGARLNAKDIAGHTACFHASSEKSNPETLEILKLIIAAKGDVNATNRVGKNALSAAILGTNMPALTALLICGANLHNKDAYGESPMDAARLYPAAMDTISAFTKSADARAAWRAEHRSCAACGATREGMSRCRRCSAALSKGGFDQCSTSIRPG